MWIFTPMGAECRRDAAIYLSELLATLFGVGLAMSKRLGLCDSGAILASAVEGRSLCNHRRAYKFFIDSVSPRCHFPAFPCDSYDNFISGKCFPCTEDRFVCAFKLGGITHIYVARRKCGNMGYYADRSKGRGQLFLITREEEPFCGKVLLYLLEKP